MKKLKKELEKELEKKEPFPGLMKTLLTLGIGGGMMDMFGGRDKKITKKEIITGVVGLVIDEYERELREKTNKIWEQEEKIRELQDEICELEEKLEPEEKKEPKQKKKLKDMFGNKDEEKESLFD